MVRPGRKMSYSDQSPQFFKIFVPDQCSKQLRIPPAFVKNFKRLVPCKSILRSLGRRSRQVDVNRVDDNLYFQNGWEEFVQDNSLEFGDFMVFCYDGNSNFNVSIFGKNNCRKEVAITAKKNDKEFIHAQGNQTLGLGNSKELICLLDSGKEVVIPHHMVPRAIQSKNPIFEITLQAAYVKRFANIPKSFHREYMKKHKRAAKLQHSSKTWLVNLVGFNSRLQFSKGWGLFVKENTMQVGDFCTFELIGSERYNYVMNVSIFRGRSNGTPEKS